MAGLECVRNKETKEPFPLSKRVGHHVIMEARKRGVIIRPLGDVIILMPPLNISERQLDTLLNAVYDSIETVTKSI